MTAGIWFETRRAEAGWLAVTSRVCFRGWDWPEAVCFGLCFFILSRSFAVGLTMMPREEAMIGPMTARRPRFDVVAGRSESESDSDSGELSQSPQKIVLVLVEFHVTPLYVGPRFALETHVPRSQLPSRRHHMSPQTT